MEMRVAQGTLLAAWPDLADPNFTHSVVLMCRHDEQGAFGLVVNRPTELKVAQLFPDHTLLGRAQQSVFLGGPVDHSSLQVLHRLPELLPGGEEFTAGLWIGADLEALGHVLAEEPARARSDVRLLLGYSGWGSGQLEQELEEGTWVPAPLAMDAVFAGEGLGTWKSVVRSIGPVGETLGSAPIDPSWN